MLLFHHICNLITVYFILTYSLLYCIIVSLSQPGCQPGNMEDTDDPNMNGYESERNGAVNFSESVIIREKTRKILQNSTKKKGTETTKKGKEETGKGSIPLLIKLEDGDNNFHSKMGKEYSNIKKRREEDKKVRE